MRHTVVVAVTLVTGVVGAAAVLAGAGANSAAVVVSPWVIARASAVVMVREPLIATGFGSMGWPFVNEYTS